MADVGVLKTRVFASMAKVFALPRTTGAGPAAREQPIVAYVTMGTTANREESVHVPEGRRLF
jgi:hypothetical protein